MLQVYTVHLDKNTDVKKFSSDERNGTKNALFLLSRAPLHHSLAFNL